MDFSGKFHVFFKIIFYESDTLSVNLMNASVAMRSFKSYIFVLLFSTTLNVHCQIQNYITTGLWPYGSSNAVEIYKGSSTYVFFNEGSVLHIGDISTQGQMQLLSSFRLTFPINYIAVSSDASRVAVCGNEKITILDTSTISSPFIAGVFDFTDPNLEPDQLGGSPKGMAFYDNDSLISTVTPKGLWALDLSNISDISIAGEYKEPGTNTVWDVEIVDGYAFVADDLEGLSVIDLSNFSNMTLAYRDSAITQARDIQIKDSIAYIGRGSQGVTLASLTTQPSLNVTVLGSITGNEVGAEWSGYVNRIQPLMDNHIGIATDLTHNGLIILNIADINNPVLIGKTGTSANQFVVDDYYIYASVGNPEIGYTDGFAIYDYKDSQSNVVVPAVEVSFRQDYGNNTNVTVDEDTVLVTTDNGGTVVVDNGNPSRPETGTWLIPDVEVDASAKINSFILSASGNDKKLYIHDISDINNPVALPSYDFGLYRPLDIIVADINSVLVVSTRNYSEYFYNWMDIDNLGNITLISQISVIGKLYYSAKSGDLVIGGGATSFYIFDFSTHTTPVFIDEYITGDVISDIEVDGNYAYIAANGINTGYGVHVYDIATPATASEITFMDTTPVPVNSVDVHNQVAYLAADKLLGIVLFDVSTPSFPQYIATYDTPDTALSVAVSDKVVALADANTGTFIFSDTDSIFKNGFE